MNIKRGYVKYSTDTVQLHDLPNSHRKFYGRTFVSIETVSLADAAHREVQRRTEASVDHAAGLPPDVVAVLTMFDALERQREDGHNNAHKRFADSINRFFDKLRTEETKYNNRMEELQVRQIKNK